MIYRLWYYAWILLCSFHCKRFTRGCLPISKHTNYLFIYFFILCQFLPFTLLESSNSINILPFLPSKHWSMLDMPISEKISFELLFSSKTFSIIIIFKDNFIYLFIDLSLIIIVLDYI